MTDAQVKYESCKAKVEAHIKNLQRLIKIHTKKMNGDEGNWGYVGDMEYVLDKVSAATEFIGQE